MLSLLYTYNLGYIVKLTGDLDNNLFTFPLFFMSKLHQVLEPSHGIKASTFNLPIFSWNLKIQKSSSNFFKFSLNLFKSSQISHRCLKFLIILLNFFEIKTILFWTIMISIFYLLVIFLRIPLLLLMSFGIVSLLLH